MTRKITVSLPDDVAERLSIESNVSRYVADSIRNQMLSEDVREHLRRSGYELTDDDLAKADKDYKSALAGITPEIREQALRLHEQIRSGRR